LPDIGRLGEPPLPSATIHPVRYFSIEFPGSNFRGVTPDPENRVVI
jgi:hypothetical protein